jgi:hypothetical protein
MCGRDIAKKRRMEIIVCMMIDVEGVLIDPLVRCMMQHVQNVDRKPRFPSSLQGIGQYTVGTVIRREGPKDN